MNTTLLFASLILMLAYSGLGWHVFNQPANAQCPATLRREQGLLGVLLIAHAAVLFTPWRIEHAPLLGIGPTLSMLLWLMLLIYWSGRFFYHLEGIAQLLLPSAPLALLAALLLPGQPLPSQLLTPGFTFHLWSSLLAYSLFAIAALLAILMLVAERRLHHKRSGRIRLPPLLTLEALAFRTLGGGYLLLTLSLLSGVLFAEAFLGQAPTLNHKAVFAVLSWLLFGGLLLGRWRYGWRGKLAARWILAGFAALFLGYIGSKVVLELILHR